MNFLVLKHYHPMIGIPFIEKHQAIFPPDPSPKPSIPHMCAAALCLGPWGAVTGKPNPTEISASGGIMMSQGTDIGMLIPHYNMIPPAPPNALLPIIIPTSGSKSEFGAHNNLLPKGPVAFAIGYIVNFNLNCAGPAWPPLPSGLVIAFNSHETNVTIGDIVSGFLHMIVDGLVQFLLNRAFASGTASRLSERLAEKLIDPILRRVVGYRVMEFAFRYGLPQLGRFGVWVGAAADQLISNLFGTVFSVFGPGSPLGYSPGYTPVGGYGGSGADWGHQKAQQAVDNLFNSPSVEQHPSQPPPSGSGTPPSTSPGGASPMGDFPPPPTDNIPV